MAFPRSDYELEQSQGRWWVVVRERDIRIQGHEDVRMEVTKRVGPFATTDHARRFATADAPVRRWDKFGDIYDEHGTYLGSNLRQAAKLVGVAHSALTRRIMNMPDGRRVVRDQHPRGSSIGKVVTEEGRYLGSSVSHAAQQLGITRAAVYSRVVNRLEDGTIVVKISGIRRGKSLVKVVTEEGRYLGDSINHAAQQLGITRASVYSRVVNRLEDGTIVVKISGIRRKKEDQSGLA